FSFQLLLMLFFSFAAYSQSGVSLSGYIRDSSSGESLIGAAVYLEEARQGTVSNAYGFFSLTVAPGTYTLQVTNVGYAPYTRTITMSGNVQLEIDLEPQRVSSDEIVITDRRPDENVSNTDMGTVNLSVETIKKLPVIFGETDVL